MKKTLIFAAIAAIFILASCQKEEEVLMASDGMSVFTAVIDNSETKTTINTDGTDLINRGKVSWEVGDEITITDNVNSAKYKINAGGIAADGSATFTYVSGNKPSESAQSYFAVYGDLISTAQTFSPNAGKLPMTGISDEGNKTKLVFTVTCGLLKLNLTAASEETDKTIKEIKITGIPKLKADITTFTLTCNPAESIESAKDFFIVLPAGSYNTMKFTNNSNSYVFKTALTNMSITKNNIQPVTISGIVFNNIQP